MNRLPHLLAGLGLGLLTMGCTSANLADIGASEVALSAASGPPGAPPGTCWGKSVEPAVIETITQQIMVQPAEVGTDGTLRAPAIFRTETRQRIVQERQETWFEAVCDARMDGEFVASLQRALRARGLHFGPISGAMDRPTQNAIRRYQALDGVKSPVLSLESGQKLGLIAIPLG